MLYQTTKIPAGQRFAGVSAIAFLVLLVSAGCERAGSAQIAAPTPSVYDLSADEAMGGHTLARHVGKTDEELRDRLRREPHISSASTYTDRATAESVVAAALSSGGHSFDVWRKRTGRRPNFVLRFGASRIIGRSIARGRPNVASCKDALVVVAWDDRRERFYVLTSYPEERR